LKSLRANGNVRLVSLKYRIRHFNDSHRTVNGQRLVPYVPQGQDEIRVAQGVIRMQVRKEDTGYLCVPKGGDSPVLSGLRDLPNASSPAIHQVRAVVHHNGQRWSLPLRIREGSARSEKDHSRFLTPLTPRPCWRRAQWRRHDSERCQDHPLQDQPSEGLHCRGLLSVRLPACMPSLSAHEPTKPSPSAQKYHRACRARWTLAQVTGRIIRHAGQLVPMLVVKAETLARLRGIRRQRWALRGVP